MTYRKIKRFMPNDWITKNKRVNFLGSLVRQLRNRREELVFFDITSISSPILKQMSWQNRLRPTGLRKIGYFKSIHLLMIVSTTRIVSFRFVQGSVKSPVIHDFIRKSIMRL